MLVSQERLKKNVVFHVKSKSVKVSVFSGGLSVAVEGPSRADITCQDNKDGTCSVTYLPVLPGEYKVIIKFADKHINGSPFTAKITGEGKKRNQISVGTASEISLMVHETDVRNLTGKGS